jgi:hypothetical protein
MAASNYIQQVMKAAGGRPKSVQWFRNKIKELGNPSATQLIRDGQVRSGRPFIGLLNMFFYDPKMKKTLPYYDKFPLIMPLEGAKGGFYGINFHYLPYGARVAFLRSLSKYASDKRYDKRTRYQLPSLSGSYYKKTIHHYLWNHVRTSFLNIPADEMAIAIFLPVARFMKGRPY